MSEELNLTLTPDTAAAVAEMPTLTLTPDMEQEVSAADQALEEQKKRDENAVKVDESMLTEAE